MSQTTTVSESQSFTTALATCTKQNGKVTCVPNTGVKYEDALSTCTADETGAFLCKAKPNTTEAGISKCTNTDTSISCEPKEGTAYNDGIVNCSVKDSKITCIGKDPLPNSVLSITHSALQLFNTIGYWLFSMTILLCIFAGWWFVSIKSDASEFMKKISVPGSQQIAANKNFMVGIMMAVLIMVAVMTGVATFYAQSDEDKKSLRAGLFSFAMALALGVFVSVWLNLDASKVAYPAGAFAMSVIILCIVLFTFVSL